MVISEIEPLGGIPVVPEPAEVIAPEPVVLEPAEGAEAKPEPVEGVPESVTEGTYTAEEFAVLGRDEQKKVWAESGYTPEDFEKEYPEPAAVSVTPAQPDLGAVISNLLQMTADVKKQKDEGEKIVQKRLAEAAEAAKGHPEVEDKYRKMREFDKEAKGKAKDGNRISRFLIPEQPYSEKNVKPIAGENDKAHQMRIQSYNANHNWERNKLLNTFEDIVDAKIQEVVLEPNQPVFDHVRETLESKKNTETWYESIWEIVKPMNLPEQEFVDTVHAIGVKIHEKNLFSKTSQIDADIRREIIRAILVESSTKPATVPVVTANDAKILQFRKSTATGTQGKPTTGNAPQRKKAPRTMGGIGVMGGKSSEIKSLAARVFEREVDFNS